MYEAHLQYGYTLKEIAEYIGLHYTAVSRAIKKLRGKIKVILPDLAPYYTRYMLGMIFSIYLKWPKRYCN
jgi:DNA-binding transcriptional ArsR family regulator